MSQLVPKLRIWIGGEYFIVLRHICMHFGFDMIACDLQPFLSLQIQTKTSFICHIHNVMWCASNDNYHNDVRHREISMQSMQSRILHDISWSIKQKRIANKKMMLVLFCKTRMSYVCCSTTKYLCITYDFYFPSPHAIILCMRCSCYRPKWLAAEWHWAGRIQFEK